MTQRPPLLCTCGRRAMAGTCYTSDGTWLPGHGPRPPADEPHGFETLEYARPASRDVARAALAEAMTEQQALTRDRLLVVETADFTGTGNTEARTRPLTDAEWATLRSTPSDGAHQFMPPPHGDGLYTTSALCSCGQWQYDGDNEAEAAGIAARADWRAHVIRSAPSDDEAAPLSWFGGPHGDVLPCNATGLHAHPPNNYSTPSVDGLREAPVMEPDDDDGAHVLFDCISSARRYARFDPDVAYRPSMTDPEVIEALMVALDEVRERVATPTPAPAPADPFWPRETFRPLTPAPADLRLDAERLARAWSRAFAPVTADDFRIQRLVREYKENI